MNGQRKPRQPRAINTNVMGHVICRVGKLMQHEIDQALLPVRTAVAALRAGTATDDHIGQLLGSMYMALAIERQGIVRGIVVQLVAARDMLRTIDREARCDGGWHTPPPLEPRRQEAIDEAFDLHEYQIKQLSAGELNQARLAAEVDIARGCEREAV